jgi:hypothetical protein
LLGKDLNFLISTKKNSYTELFNFLETKLPVWGCNSIANDRYVAIAWKMKGSKIYPVRWITNLPLDNLVEEEFYIKVFFIYFSYFRNKEKLRNTTSLLHVSCEIIVMVMLMHTINNIWK